MLVARIRLNARTLAAAFCALLVANVAGAQETPALPFVPPVNWNALPTSIIPTPILSWRTKSSGFAVVASPYAVPPETIMTAMQPSAAKLGNVTITKIALCGNSAEIMRVKMTAQPMEMTEQIQSIGDKTYIVTYTRLTSMAADPHILSIMHEMCGVSSIAALKPPTNWSENAGRMLGIWMGDTPTQSVILISQNAATDAETAFRNATSKTLNGTSIKILSKSTGTLCGLPSDTFVAESTGGRLPLKVRTVMTQSATTAYVLMYSHPPTMADSPAAIASLATLCAKGLPSPLPSASPVPTPVESPSATPTDRATLPPSFDSASPTPAAS